MKKKQIREWLANLILLLIAVAICYLVYLKWKYLK